MAFKVGLNKASSLAGKLLNPLVRVQPSTNTFRVMALVLVALMAIFKTECDSAVAHFWTWLCGQWWFRHDSFEPMLATFSFFPWLFLFYTLDMHTPSAKPYRIQKHRDDMSNWNNTGAGSFSGWPILLGYILPLLAFDYFYPRRSLPAQPPTAWGLVAEIIALLVLYDALFFLCHRGMHMHRGLYHRFHALHHAKPVTRAFDAIRLTYVEELVDVACSIVGVNILGAHPLSRAVYNAIIVYLLVELHCGYDMPWMPHNLVPFKLMGGPVRHDAHHVNGQHYFQKFFTYLDVSFGPLKRNGRQHHAGRKRLSARSL